MKHDHLTNTSHTCFIRNEVLINELRLTTNQRRDDADSGVRGPVLDEELTYIEFSSQRVGSMRLTGF